MKRKIVLLSDLWGARKSAWIAHFEQALPQGYELQFFDVCELGEIDLSIYEEANIHRQFVDFGIQKAARTLSRFVEEAHILIGCSVGGVIAWKAALLGMPVEKLVAISATRLRKETAKPDCKVQLYYGGLDPYQPSSEWLKSMKIAYEVLPDCRHELYTKEKVIQKIVRSIF